jgi:Fe-S cluster biosynthesis and repair protein YggX
MSDHPKSDESGAEQPPQQAPAAGKEPAVEDGVYMVDCVKFGKRMPGLKKPPLKGEIGEKVYTQVSQDAWTMWLEHSKMLVNEFRLDLMSEQGQSIWFTELEKYFWGEGSKLPPDFTPNATK